jgi:hypothetical protein
MTMDAQGKDVAHITELTASAMITPATGSMSAAINLRTPDAALAVVVVVGVVIGLGAMTLAFGLSRYPHVPTEDEEGRSPQRLEPSA